MVYRRNRLLFMLLPYMRTGARKVSLWFYMVNKFWRFKIFYVRDNFDGSTYILLFVNQTQRIFINRSNLGWVDSPSVKIDSYLNTVSMNLIELPAGCPCSFASQTQMLIKPRSHRNATQDNVRRRAALVPVWTRIIASELIPLFQNVDCDYRTREIGAYTARDVSWRHGEV